VNAKAIVVVDSREKDPYTFDPARVEVVRCALPAGDYSLLGLEDKVSIERKSLEDFVGTVIRERERFRNELLKLREYEYACVVVEANLADILSGNYRSGAHPKAILGSALSLIVDYRIPVFFCGNRQAARLFVEQLLLKYSGKVDSACQPHQQ